VQVGTSSVAGIDDAFGLKVFPNPATDQVTLEFLKATDEPLEVKVTGADGRVVLARSLAPQTTRVALNTASLPAGAYQVLIIGATGVSVQSLAVVR
jgi:hypothetical protein